jgi:hypothetical protein
VPSYDFFWVDKGMLIWGRKERRKVINRLGYDCITYFLPDSNTPLNARVVAPDITRTPDTATTIDVMMSPPAIAITAGAKTKGINWPESPFFLLLL